MSIFNFLRRSRKFKKKELRDVYAAHIDKLEKIVGYRITDNEYYLKALTHRSFLGEDDKFEKSNERLEYLGDAVLDLIVGEFFFTKFLGKEEGFLTKARSHIVDRESLSRTAKRIGMEDLVFFKKNFLGNSDEGLKTILADAYEALAGAVYMDKGIEAVRKFINNTLIDPSYVSGEFKIDRNFKGQLLEFTHSNKMKPPVYKITSSDGPEHDKTFIAKVFIDEIEFGQGVGKNKKSAEQKAAKIALQKMQNKSSVLKN
jgi:ribonuclease-3